MDILLLNQAWLKPELEALGHRIVSAGSFTPHLDVNIESSEISYAELTQALPEGFTPNRIVYFDDSGVPWFTDLEDIHVPKVFYSVDSHHHHGWHGELGAMFDHVLAAQKDFLGIFARNAERVSWFPPWTTRPMDIGRPRDIDVCFRGTLDPGLNPGRLDFFSKLARFVHVDCAMGDYTLAYPRAKIVINHAVGSDLNFRVFEALASGALLITPDSSNGLDSLFTSGVDLVVYRDGDERDAAEKIRYYLNCEDERTKIAESGRIKVQTLHSSAARASQLASLLENLPNTPAKPDVRYCAARSYLFCHLVSKVQNAQPRPRFLSAATRNLLKSVADEYPAEGEAVGLALVIASELGELGFEAESNRLIGLLQRAYPANAALYQDALQ